MKGVREEVEKVQTESAFPEGEVPVYAGGTVTTVINLPGGPRIVLPAVPTEDLGKDTEKRLMGRSPSPLEVMEVVNQIGSSVVAGKTRRWA